MSLFDYWLPVLMLVSMIVITDIARGVVKTRTTTWLIFTGFHWLAIAVLCYIFIRV